MNGDEPPAGLFFTAVTAEIGLDVLFSAAPGFPLDTSASVLPAALGAVAVLGGEAPLPVARGGGGEFAAPPGFDPVNARSLASLSALLLLMASSTALCCAVFALGAKTCCPSFFPFPSNGDEAALAAKAALGAGFCFSLIIQSGAALIWLLVSGPVLLLKVFGR